MTHMQTVLLPLVPHRMPAQNERASAAETDMCVRGRLWMEAHGKCVVEEKEFGGWREGNRGCSERSYALWQALIACGSCCVFGFV